jgi:hypothetical protein
MIDFSSRCFNVDAIMQNDILNLAMLRNCDAQLTAYLNTHCAARDLVFAVICNGVSYQHRLGRLHILIKFWVPMAEFQIPFRYAELPINITDNIHNKVLSQTFDYIVYQITMKHVDLNVANDSLSGVLEAITAISARANDLEGNTINLYDLCVASEQDARVDQLLNIEIPPGQPKDVEDYLKAATRELSALLIQYDTCFKPFLQSGTGVNPDQLQQTMVAIGSKPTYSGDRAYNHTINTSWINGIKSVADLLVVSHSTRKAMIIKSRMVPESDTLRRYFQFLVIDVMLNPDVHDCGSKHLIPVLIFNERIAKRYIGRYFALPDGNYKMYALEDMVGTIGQTLYFRSPMTCRAPVCRTCYGALADINYNVHIGTLSNLYLTNALTQRLLSAKHLQKTDSEHVEFPEPFADYFYMDGTDIRVHEGLDNIRLRIYEHDLDTDNYLDSYRVVNRFYVVPPNGNELQIDSPVQLVLDDSWDLTTMEEFVELDLSTLSSETPVFAALIANRDLSYALGVVQKLIINNSHDGYERVEMNDQNQGLLMAVLEAFDGEALNFDIAGVHLEILLSQLMFTDTEPLRKLDLFEYPNTPQLPPYKLLGIGQAIARGPSVVRALLFERLKATASHPDMLLANSPGKRPSILDAIYP